MRTGISLHLDSDKPAKIGAKFFNQSGRYDEFVVLQMDSGRQSLALHIDADQGGADMLRDLAAHAKALADRIEGSGRLPVLVQEISPR